THDHRMLRRSVFSTHRHSSGSVALRRCLNGTPTSPVTPTCAPSWRRQGPREGRLPAAEHAAAGAAGEAASTPISFQFGCGARRLQHRLQRCIVGGAMPPVDALADEAPILCGSPGFAALLRLAVYARSYGLRRISARSRRAPVALRS